MKVKDFLILSIGSVLVVFMLLSFFYEGGQHYGMDESNNYGNISLAEFKDSLDSAQETSETLQEVFESDSTTVTAFNLVIKGLPSAGKTIFRWSIDSVKLVLVGASKVLATPAFLTAFGVLMALFIIILIITNWDWIRGVKPGS
jgi:hypothetical protein